MGSPSRTVHAEGPIMRPGRRLAAPPGMDAYTALTLMRHNEVRHLPVVDGDRCVGLLTEFDLVRALASEISAASLTAGALCHRPAPTVPAGSSLQEMAATMVARGCDATLVVKQGVVVGMVTAGDVLGAVTEKWRAPAEDCDADPLSPASRQSSGRGTP